MVGPALAVDVDNNGIDGDQGMIQPEGYDGETDRDEVVVFPTSQDTWVVNSYPYWWHVGDTVYGVHDVALETVCHADIELYLIYNSLVPDCGYVDLQFQIDGTVVGDFRILPEDGLGPINASFDFEPMSPPFELRYYETNQVVGGCGSISLDESGLNSVTFSDDPSPAAEGTWGEVKALFQ
ncbi:MAG: hypothetical protein GF330_07135 [Candidatus Eisenbacteria bacterium]|nr:hypothetical protein [Candidatus Eisenbacteria bacterium]